MSYLPTVFILGAGASCHTGAPLLQNFLSAAMNVMDGLGDDDKSLYPIFEKVFVYIAENDALEPLLGCDFRNIEHVFSMVDLEARVLPRSQEIREALLRVILETLVRTIKAEEMRQFNIACNNARDVAVVESTPLETLVNLVADRTREGRPNEPCRNTIISLNYDTLVEQAIQSAGGLEPDYCSDELGNEFGVDNRARIRLLKLHGSSNWRMCQECKTTKILGFSARAAETTTCKCGKPMSPMLVPPSWEKSIHTPALKRVWEEAFNYLKIARHWVFIGTSLPETDQYLRYLFAVSLRHNAYLRRVTIVDPRGGAAINKLFEKSASRIHVQPIPLEMVSALGGDATPGALFKEVRCFAPNVKKAYLW